MNFIIGYIYIILHRRLEGPDSLASDAEFYGANYPTIVLMLAYILYTVFKVLPLNYQIWVL